MHMGKKIMLFSLYASPHSAASRIQTSFARPATDFRQRDVTWCKHFLAVASPCAPKYTKHPCRQALSDSLYMLQAVRPVLHGT